MKWLISICGLLVILTACSNRQAQPVSETACAGACQSADVGPAEANAEPTAEAGGTVTGASPVTHSPPEPAEVWIVVDGMTKVQGIT